MTVWELMGFRDGQGRQASATSPEGGRRSGFPWLQAEHDEAEWAAQCLALEDPDDWRGYFLCSVALVEAEAI